jgi:hypothetical protein
MVSSSDPFFQTDAAVEVTMEEPELSTILHLEN